MYYDADGPIRLSTDLPAPFRIDFVVGGDADCGCVTPAQPLPLGSLYYCDACSRVVGLRDLAEDVDSYYCPNCLENMPSSEAMLYGMRCSKCWECPVCANTLSISTNSATDQTHHLTCLCCRWSSRGRQEAAQPEQLVAKIIALEREAGPRQRMAALVDAFRARAQEQQRERELQQRLRRRSSTTRASFAMAALSNFAARRFSSHMMLRGARGMTGMGALDGFDRGAGASGVAWRFDDLEAKLAARATRQRDLRADARAAAAAKAEAAKEATRAAEAGGSSPSAEGGAATAVTSLGGQPFGAAPEVPTLESLTVEELLKAHTEAACSEGAGGATVEELLLRSVGRGSACVDGREGFATLPQRLQQISYGYLSRAPEPGGAPGGLRLSRVQLEAPLDHEDTWALLPVRKPLLTKRSRRCRLLVENTDAKASADGAPPPRFRACKAIVVKPQISPCANPPFQKNNVAVAFIPRCSPWAWMSESGAGEGGKAKMAASAVLAAAAAAVAVRSRPQLRPGEAGELVFAMLNPLDVEVQVAIDPTICNQKEGQATEYAKGTSLGVLVAEQNVQVLTQPFTTVIPRHNELADVHDSFSGEDAERLNSLKAMDDKDVIPDRRMHKVLVRIRFRANAEASVAPEPWAFYAAMAMSFTDAAGNSKEVKTVLRFGHLRCAVTAPPPGAFAPPPEAAADVARDVAAAGGAADEGAPQAVSVVATAAADAPAAAAAAPSADGAAA